LIVLFCEIIPIRKIRHCTAHVTPLLCLLYVEYRDKYYKNCGLWEYLFVFLLVYFVYRIDCYMRKHSLSKT